MPVALRTLALGVPACNSEASLCIPAVLLKTTLQIYQHTLPNDDEVRDVINLSLESLKDLPPLIPKTTLH